MPAAVSRSLSFSDFSTERVPISTGRPCAVQPRHLLDDGVELGVLGGEDAVGPVLADAPADWSARTRPRACRRGAAPSSSAAAVPVMPASFLYSRK